MDYFGEYKKLYFSKPHNCVSSRAVENSSYGDYLYRSKNAYLSYFLTDCEDCYYSEYLSKCRDCIDCNYLAASELCYECEDSSGLYNCSYLQDSHNCSNCDFCFDCMNCKNCFGCFGLRHQQFCIFNKSYDEETYNKKIATLRKNPPHKVLNVLSPEFNKSPRLYARLLKGEENCLGDYIFYSKNCYNCFNVRNAVNCTHVSEILDPEISTTNCVDCNFINSSDSCFDCYAVSGCTNLNFARHCINSSDCEYVFNCYNSRNCFLCVYLTNKEYCILNRQFERAEYFALLSKIKSKLKAEGFYGKHLADILL